jgi:SAM-dependent methyltransferase
MFVHFLSTANRRLPFIKHVLSDRIRRWTLLKLFGVQQGYMPTPSREWLEKDVLPLLPSLNYSRCLFVGAAPYTWHYEKIVTTAGGEWYTLDIRPSARVWGARNHVISPIQEAHLHFNEHVFDAVILNGVFGFGINSKDEKNCTIQAINKILRSDGLLLIGWNTELMESPLLLPSLQESFAVATTLPFPAHVEFTGETHVYEFQIKGSECCC